MHKPRKSLPVPFYFSPRQTNLESVATTKEISYISLKMVQPSDELSKINTLKFHSYAGTRQIKLAPPLPPKPQVSIRQNRPLKH